MKALVREQSFENLTLMSLKGRGKKEEQVSSWAQVCLSCFSEARAYRCECDAFKWPVCFSYRPQGTCLPWARSHGSPEEAQPLGWGLGGAGPEGGKSLDLSPPLGEHRGSSGAPVRGNHKVRVAERCSQ